MLSMKLFSRAAIPLALVGLAGLSMTALAHDDVAAHADASANQVVIKDAVTGHLRMPTTDEMKELHAPAANAVAARQRARAAEEPMAKWHRSGARGARLTADFASYTVAVRQADGSYAMQCFDSREQAEVALKVGAAPKSSSTAATE